MQSLQGELQELKKFSAKIEEDILGDQLSVISGPPNSVDHSSPNDAVQTLHISCIICSTSHGATSTATDAEPTGGSAEPASAALAIAVDLARQALLDAESRLPPDAQADEDLAQASKQLGEARMLLAGGGAAGPLPSTRQTAQAYDCVQKARQLLRARGGETGEGRGPRRPGGPCLAVLRGAVCGRSPELPQQKGSGSVCCR